MTRDLFENLSLSLQDAFTSLRKDLIQEGGPSISTMRNYRFAILQYQPADEFKLRAEVQRLSIELEGAGWFVLSINLQALLLDRVRNMGEDWMRSVSGMERRTAKSGQGRGLRYLQDKLAPLIEGPEGIAADCSRIIGEYVDEHPDKIDHTVALIGRSGSLYPFFRSSALLKHLDGRTRNIPVVLLYPGERRAEKGLSFMGVLAPDSDYRPRIYP
jgi:hypothetical protein